MSSDEPNAAWHPAFMPHTAKKPAPSEPAAVAQEPEETQPSDTPAPAFPDLAHDANDDSAIDAWFPAYDVGSPLSEHPPSNAFGAALPETTAAPEASPEAALEAAPVPDAAPEPTPEQTEAPTEPSSEPEPAPEPTDEAAPEPAETTPVASPISETASKHLSTISFTRTVSNDVNWDAEEDDPEWNLTRADTDPFQFMSPSDRTNSFPVVPPLTEQDAPSQHDQQPLASSQAMDIIHEVDTEVSSDAKREAIAAPDAPQAASLEAEEVDAAIDAWDLEADEDIEGGSFFAGAVAGEEEDAAQTPSWEAPETPDARFEEGIPLIAHETSTETDAAQTQEQTQEREAKDPFAEDGGDEEDDFFNSGPSADADAAAPSPAPPAFERKSTMQVLQSINVGSITHKDSQLDATPEEPVEEAAETAEIKHSGSGGDLATKWAAVFDDEDELLLEDSVVETGTKELDPAAFFGDDDEGFLEDEIEEPASEPSVPQTAPAPQQQQPAASNPYLPQAAQAPTQQPLQAQQPANLYLPTASFVAAQPVVPSPYAAPAAAPKQFPVSYGYDAPVQAPPQQQARPTLHKAQSFADKPKDGYHSPYDLPMDFVKPPRKRQSMQQLRATEAAPAPPQAPPPQAAVPPQGPPPRSSSMHAYSPTKDAFSSIPPPAATHSIPPPPAPATSTPPQPTKHESFFEDLPMLPKVRPASRHSLPSPSQTTPYAVPPPPHTPTTFQHPPPQAQAPPQPSPYAPAPAQTQTPSVPPPSAHYAPPTAASATTAPPPHPAATQPPAPGIAGLVAPPRVNPYATPQSGPSALGPPAPGPGSVRYSPSPNQLPPPNGAAQPSRYSPAPPPRVPSAGYAPAPAGVTPPILPHQPRTSSPLAHFEMSYDKPRTSSVGHQVLHGEGHFAERRGSSSHYESRLNRVPSLPPTREEEEEPTLQPRTPSSGTAPQQYPPAPTSQTSQTSQTHQYSPLKPRQTPPPPSSSYGQATLSPPKRIVNYAPQPEGQHSPPRRSQTQSPGALYGSRTVTRPVDPIPRPSSVHEAAAPAPARPRAASQNLNLVPPTDGSETDPLQRWKGAPIFAWGVGGTFVSSFPQDVPRYGMGQALPMIHRAAGNVQVKNIKELQPLEERLAKFPGPLKGKSKKKEVLAWLSTGIEGLERALPSNGAFAVQVSHDDKRLEERVLLWKILQLFIEHDGVLEGNPTVDKAVREVLSPYAADALSSGNADAGGATGYPGFQGASSLRAQSDAVDSTVVEQIRKDLLLGDKEKAAWNAVDKRLWGHAFLIAGAASRELFKKVAQEFVRKEVNTPGLNNESLAALYEVLSGNHEECVDELVPVHARAGLQLMTTTQAFSASQSKDNDELAGLDKWRETLCLVLSNRSLDDVQAINSLGNLLSGYGRAEAAHVCFLFARGVTVFGGLDDPAADFVLLGADHKRQLDAFAKETDAVLLSEVYEYGLSLSATASNLGASQSPHLAAYKLQHAMVLAEYGLRDRALQYCEAIVAAISAQTRRSPYYHPLLETAVEDLTKRLRQAPRDESASSWISKPSMNKVSDTVWNRFNKFVAGDDSDGAGGAGGGGGGSDGEFAGAESGPFARIAGGTPTISRPPSAGGIGGATGMEMFGSPGSSFPGPGYGGLNSSSSTTSMPGPYGALNGAAAAPPPPVVPGTRAASRYAPGAAGQPIPAAAPASAPNPYEPNAGYTPLGVAAAAVVAAPAHSAYEPASAYGAPPSRRVSADQSGAEAYQPRTSSELSPGYSPYAPNNTTDQTGHGLGLARKSSYALLPQADVAPSVTGYGPPSTETTPAYNPYAPPSDTGLNGSPYAPVTTGTAATTTTTAPLPAQEETPESQPEYGYQPPSYGYEPPSFEPAAATATSEPAEESAGDGHTNGHANGYSGGGYESPSFQPYSYEPPSYEPDEDAEGGGGAAAASGNEDAYANTLPKKKSFIDDDGDDIPAARTAPGEKSREEKDRENAEMFRKIAEEEAKRAAAEKEAKAKKGWGLTSWWSKKDDGAAAGGSGSGNSSGSEAPKAVRANLGEKSSFVFDPELKRWVNKNAGPDDQAAKAAPPQPPPRSGPHSATSTPPPPMGGGGGGGGPPPSGPPAAFGGAPPPPHPSTAPPMARTSSAASIASGPPSRPATSMSDANSIDDLLGAAPGPRKAGAKKGRKSGRYVDVMAK